MAEITLNNPKGTKAGTVELDDATFGIQPNVPVMHQVVTAQLAARRSGTQSTKTRSEVRGGGIKPYRQKGTGNARQGSIRAPHYSGGGVALGPKPRKYNQKTPKKMIALALRSALSDRARDNKVIVVDAWGWDKPSTKSAAAALDALGVAGKALVVVGRDDATAALSFRNLINVHVTSPGELSAYDVLCHDYIVFTKDALPAGDGAGDSASPKAAKKAAKKSADAEPAAKKAAADKPAAKKSAAKKSAAKTSATAKADDAAAVDGDDSAASVQAFADTSSDDQTDDKPAGSDSAGSGEVEAAEWPGSVKALDDGSQPEGYDIKGNADSMLYHTPGSRFYKRTKAEVWFDTEENAEAAGFSKPASQQAAESESEES